MRTGIVVRAWRRQMGVLILWDDAETPTASRHDAAVNPVDDATDMTDGRGVPLGARVEELPEGRFRLTGEVVEVEGEPEPTVRKGLDTPEAVSAWLRSLPHAKRLAAWLDVAGRIPIDPDLEDELSR